MKSKIFIITFSFMFLLTGFSKANDFVNVTITTVSNRNTIKFSYKVGKWTKNANLISIQLTNSGTQTELVKDILVKINNTPSFNENAKFLYGGSCMGRSFIQQRGYDDSNTTTETVLLAKANKNQLYKVGILTWEIFQAKISHSKSKGISIAAQGENKPIKPGETINFERFIIETGTDWQDMLYAYGEQIAKYHNIVPKKIIPFKGWSTWDYYGGNFTDKEIELNTKLLKEMDINANIIQVDGGWWTKRGDYLSTKPTINGGMKGIANMIKSYGYTPGIHIDGFRGDKESEIYKAHPEYFLKDQNGETYPNDSITNKTTLFDFSNPATCAYIKNVLKTMREEWGYQYFKVDFIRYGVNEEVLRYYKDNGLTGIQAFDPTMTSFERIRAGLKAMREGIDSAYFLGCSAVFGGTLGIVDGLRTGGDIFPNFESYTTRCLMNGGNFYLHKAVVQTDADYLIVRNKDDEELERAWKNKFGGTITRNEAKMWADYVALFGGSKFSSDNLNTLRPERKELVKNAFELETCERYIPIDLWDKANNKDDAFSIMLGKNKEGIYLALFNWNEKELGINLSNIPTANIQAVNSIETPVYTAKNNLIDVKLKARTSIIFKLKQGSDFDKVRKKIEYQFSK